MNPRRPALLALAAALALSLGACTSTPDGAPTPTPTPTPAADAVIATAAPDVAAGDPAALAFPEVGSGAVGIAADDGSVQLLGQGGDTGTVPIASITKVITALVVLSAHPLADASDPGPTITLLTSANNYAESVARWAFGSQEAYLQAARAWLASHGLTATTLADASGLDPGSASSSAELLRIAALAHADPALASIAGTATLDQADLGTIANQNVLLGEGGVDGLKTGSTSYARFTLLTSAVVTVGTTPVTLVSVVLGTDSLDARFDTTRALLSSAEAGLREVPLAAEGQAFGSYTASGSTADAVDAVATAPASAVVFGDTPVTVEVRLDPLRTGAAGDAVGTAVFTGGSSRAEVPLELAGDLG